MQSKGSVRGTLPRWRIFSLSYATRIARSFSRSLLRKQHLAGAKATSRAAAAAVGRRGRENANDRRSFCLGLEPSYQLFVRSFVPPFVQTDEDGLSKLRPVYTDQCPPCCERRTEKNLREGRRPGHSLCGLGRSVGNRRRRGRFGQRKLNAVGVFTRGKGS